MSSSRRVLCFSRDNRLLGTRRLILEKRFDTATASSVDEIAAMDNEESFDLVIFCHTLSEEDRSSTFNIVRTRWPAAKILVLTAEQLEFGAPIHGPHVPGLDGPRVLLHKVAAMLEVP